MIQIDSIATNLVDSGGGLWISKDRSAVSYPAGGMDFTYQLEDQSYWFRHRNRCITSLINHFRPDGIFFDVGGGNGYVSLAVQNMGIQTVLVEPDPVGSRNALNRGLHPVISATLADACFKPGSLDAVGIFDVLEHIEQDLQFLNELHTLIKMQGRLFITVPAFQFLWSIDDVSAGHFRRYRLPQLTRLLETAGFTVDFSTYIFGLLPLPIALFRTLPSRLGWRGKIELDDPSTQNEYVTSTPLVEQILSLELPFISRLHPLPFGGSILLAASRK